MKQAGPGTSGAPDTAAPHWEYIGVITPGWKYTRPCARVCLVVLSNAFSLNNIVIFIYFITTTRVLYACVCVCVLQSVLPITRVSVL